MAFHWKKTRRGVLAGKEKGKKKYYGVIRHERTVRLKEMANKVSDWYPMKSSFVEEAVKNTGEQILLETVYGNIVRIEGLGSFRVTFRSEGSEKKNFLSAGGFHSPKLVFTPSREVRDKLKALHVSRAGEGKVELLTELEHPATSGRY